LVSERLLSSGIERVWVRAFELGKYPRLTEREQFYTVQQAPLSPAPTRVARTIWSFARGAPGAWSGASAVRSRTTRGAAFLTSPQQWNYELVSPDVRLPAGAYAVYVRGNVVRGGLDLGVLDAGAQTWIEQRLYWDGQTGVTRRWMATPFHLNGPTTVRFIFSNWVPRAERSRWQLRELRLVRLRP
jgi:hypothetical protein